MKEEGALTKAVQSDNRRTQLEGIRDYIVHELDGKRCDKCAMSVIRTGEIAALTLRLTKVLEDLAELSNSDPDKKSDLDKLREASTNVVPFGRREA